MLKKNLSVVGVYIRPMTRGSSAEAALNKLYNGYTDKRDRVILVGDINVRHRS